MKITTTKTLIAIGLLCFSASSMAQWQWVDRSGRKVFSDQPPPTDIPERSIIKRPGGVSAPVSMATGNEEKASTSESASAPRLTPEQQKEKEEKAKEEAQRKDEEAKEAAKRKAEEAKNAQAKKENCDRARTALSTLQSGIRIRTVDAKGEHTILDDKARATEEARIRKDIADNC